LDLDTLKWQKLADGRDLFNPNYRWHYCALNEDGTQAWLIGCPADTVGNGAGTAEEYLSDVLPIDLRKLGLLGNNLRQELDTTKDQANLPASDTVARSHLSGIGADLALMFDQPPESGSGTDFVVTAMIDYEDGEDTMVTTSTNDASSQVSRPIHVHKLILQARWPHFKRLYASQMLEFHTKKLHIPEPYSSVRAFLKYLYTDSIAAPPTHSNPGSTTASPSPSTSTLSTIPPTTPTTHHPDDDTGPTLSDVAGMLILSQCYDMPKLRHLCVNRLYRDLDVPHAATIWHAAGVAGETFLHQYAASFIWRHWGRVTKTCAFKELEREALVELCGAGDAESRIVSGEELELVGGLGGGKFGEGGIAGVGGKRKGSVAGMSTVEDDDGEEEGEEGMDVS
jgi:hypothetical protein